MRLRYLNAQNTRVKGLAPLKGMPIKSLILNSSPVNNITALRSIPVQILELNDTLVTHLPDINVTKLEKLFISDTPLKNINSLKNANLLREISISNTQVRDLSSLFGKNLESVHMTGTPATSISPLINTKLKSLHITGSLINDFNSIKDAKSLESLYAHNCGLSDISGLEGLPLIDLDLSENINIRCIKALADANLKYLNLHGTSVTDLSPLSNSNIKELYLEGTPVKDLKPLASLKSLNLLCLKRCRKISSMKPLLQCKSLEKLRFHPLAPDAYLLKNHPTITNLSLKGNFKVPEIFWQAFERNHLKENN